MLARCYSQLDRLGLTYCYSENTDYLSTEAGNLLRGLLQKDAQRRLGFGPAGSATVMNHPFFKEIDWKQLEARSVASPFKPNIRSHDSVENFDKIWTDLPVQVSLW